MIKNLNKLSILQVFGILALLYFGTHVVVGYIHCEYSDYVNCPGYMWSSEEDGEE